MKVCWPNSLLHLNPRSDDRRLRKIFADANFIHFKYVYLGISCRFSKEDNEQITLIIINKILNIFNIAFPLKIIKHTKQKS